jgi:drug/metabolite transporter (DMT)-like permease
MSPSSKRRRPPPSPSRPRPERAPVTPATPPRVPSDAEVARPDAADRGPELGRAGRFAPAAGIAYALLAFLGSSLLPIGRVEPQDDAAAIARELTENRGRVSAGVLLMLFSLFFLTVFVAWLHRWLSDVEGRGGWLATLALIGGVLMVAAMSVVVLLAIAGTVLEDFGPDPVIARTLLVLQWQGVAISFIPTDRKSVV